MRPLARFVVGFVFTWLALVIAAMIFGASSCHASQYDYLTANDLTRIRAYMPIYKVAADCVGVPVLALPAIHYRESDLRGARGEKWCRGRVRCIGGPFMLDCGGEGTDAFDVNVRAYEQKVAARFLITPVPRVRDDFAFACLVAACELQDKVRGKLYDRLGAVNVDVLADAAWGYNGRVGASWRKSAYVNNHPKAGRQLTVRIPVGVGGFEYTDQRPGVIVLYREIVRRIGQ